MNTPFFIAKKYFGNYLLRPKKNKYNAIQVLTMISIITVLIVTMSGIIVLSVFNGLNVLLGEQNYVFYPDLRIEPTKGKVFPITSEQLDQIKDIPGVQAATPIVEEMALIEYNGRQQMGTVKGVDSTFLQVSNILDAPYITDEFLLKNENHNFAIVGLGLANDLHINIRNPFRTLTIFVPQNKKRFAIGPPASLGTMNLQVSGSFAIQREFDMEYVFVPLSLLKPILQYDNELSFVEIREGPNSNPKKIRQEIQNILGDGVIVKNRQQINESFYRVMNLEKWLSFAIIVLIMIIASFNLLNSLTMMVLDKRKDISILKAIGLGDQKVASIFRWQGLLIGIIGGLLGGILSCAIVLLQMKFGFIPLKGSFVTDSYPIQLEWIDVGIVLVVVILISWLTSLYPSMRARNQLIQDSI